jgi:glycosyltransferase involved in cell wall biosynthesis
MVTTRAENAWTASPYQAADVCLIVEGCYPFVPGGVSGWIDWLIRGQPERTFSVVSLWPTPNQAPPRYQRPDNVVAFHPLYLQDFGARPGRLKQHPEGIEDLADRLSDFMTAGGIHGLANAVNAHRSLVPPVPLATLFNSDLAWDLVGRIYRRQMPYGSFLHFFWAWRALLGGLFATLDFPLPEAKVYHTISTGYAGVLAARAVIETRRPMVLTEHGIYTNERRLELLMAEWVADTIDKGHALEDPRQDLRDMWIGAFEAYARACYESATSVVTLFEDNQRMQRMLGAAPERSTVIANGIDLGRFETLARAADDARPTMALIGRVVPIKDVKCFITAAQVLRERMPALRAIVMGPLDEDPGYADECRRFATELGLDGCVEFTGAVDITRYLPDVHVVVLTSLSESQPLTLLEAGAAGIPFVATNVGSCREIIEGRSDEDPPLGRGGIVTGLVAPTEIAGAVQRLLVDHDFRRACGAALQRRVKTYYTSEAALAHYRDLYRRFMAMGPLGGSG